MSTITQLNRRANLKPFRKVEMKRRLSDGSGNYESNWLDVTDYIVQLGTVSWELDTEQVGVFKQSSMTLIGDNTYKAWNEPIEANSLFAGFLTRYKTFFKVSYGLLDDDGTLVPSTNSVFYGVLTDDITITEIEAVLVINSVLSVFAEQSASALTLSATDTASDIMTKIMAIQDAGGNRVFDRFISGSSATASSTQYPDVTAGSNLENQSCLDIINRLCLVEDYACFIGNEGSLYFKPKISGTAVTWKFNGPGIYDETYGVNIAEISQGNYIWTKVYNKVAIEHTENSFGTAGAVWQQGDASSQDKYGEKTLSISEFWLGSTQAAALAGSLYANYKDPKREAVIRTSTFNPELKLLDRVALTYYGENTTTDPGLFGVSVFGSVYSPGVGLFTGKKGGVYFDNVPMNIIGVNTDLDNMVTNFRLREV